MHAYGLYPTYITYIAVGPPFPPAPCSNTPPSPQWLYDLQDIHFKLMHSFHNRQICFLKGFIVSAHILSPPPPTAHFHPRSPFLFFSLSPRSRHQLYDVQYILDKLIHLLLLLLQLSDCVPLKNGFYSFRGHIG